MGERKRAAKKEKESPSKNNCFRQWQKTQRERKNEFGGMRTRAQKCEACREQDSWNKSTTSVRGSKEKKETIPREGGKKKVALVVQKFNTSGREALCVDGPRAEREKMEKERSSGRGVRREGKDRLTPSGGRSL